MIPQNIMMSRESRRLLVELDQLAQEYKTSTLVTPSQVYITDQVILKYYTAPILNAIKSKVKGLKKISSKHFTIEHWISVLDSMFGNNMSVRRENSIIQIVDGNDGGLGGFQQIIRYLITDYGLQDTEHIYTLVHKFTDVMIKDAIKIAIDNKVYNIHYVTAILENMQAKSNIRQQEIAQLRDKANLSNNILHRQKVEHTVIEMASTQYGWEQAKQNAELEKMLNDKFGE